MNRLKRIISKTLAVTEKEIRIKLRFKLNYLNETLLFPFLTIAPYIVIFFGFFVVSAGSVTINSVSQANFMTWLLLGVLLSTFFKNGFMLYEYRFRIEKYWGTIESTFLSPSSEFIILLGYSLALLIQSIPFIVLIFFLSYFFFPTLILNLFIILIFIGITIIGVSGLGLIRGSLSLANEDVIPIFVYIEFVLLFFSTNTIPLEMFPGFLQFFVLINPLYHGFQIIRDLWFLNPINLFSVIYYFGFQITTFTLGLIYFRRIWRKFGIQG